MTCPACDGPLAPWRAVPGGEPSDHASHELLRCGTCGTAVTVDEPAPDAYESGLYSPEQPRLAPIVRALMRLALRQPRRMLPASGRVVDVGAGSGLLVEVLRDAGVDAYGIEPAPRSVARAHDAGRPVEEAALERHEARDLDAAILWHVLEHVEDPGRALSRVRSWLRDGGRVLVAVPNVGSLQAAIAGRSWFHLDVPRHRSHFSSLGLRRLLEREGYEVVRERHFVVEHNLHGMWFALLERFGMTPGFPFHLLKRNVAARPKDLLLLVFAGPLLLVPAVLLEALAAALRRGGTIAVVAQRRS
jgi:SAM-dependent methyltransferase